MMCVNQVRTRNMHCSRCLEVVLRIRGLDVVTNERRVGIFDPIAAVSHS